MLEGNHENNHVINQTEEMINQVLHIHFKPLSTLAPGFVVKLILTRYVVIVTSLFFNQQASDLFLVLRLVLIALPERTHPRRNALSTQRLVQGKPLTYT